MKSIEIPTSEGTQKEKRAVNIILQIVLSVAIILGGMSLAFYYLRTGPEAKPRKRQPSPPLVQIQQVNYGTHQLTVSGMGTVVAAKEINLSPGVGGEIIALSPNMVPGGFFMEDETLVNIDPIDYKLAIMQLESEVAKAQNDFELEMGNQRIAQQEYELLGQEVSETEKKLMLREPQLEIKKATLQGVQASLDKAELNLQRTKVKAPFNGVILSRSVNIGARVSQSSELARLVGTDTFWLKLAIPTDQLGWISFPANDGQGSRVQIFLQEKRDGGPVRTGRVIRLAADIEEKGRMAAVYVAIEDPLCLLPQNEMKPKLLLGSFVQADIEGKELPSVVPINRNYLRENDTIWLMKDDNTMEIRKVDIIARTNDSVYVQSGLKNGDKMIVSDLSSPVAGTLVQLLQEGQGQPDRNRTADANDLPTKKGAVLQ